MLRAEFDRLVLAHANPAAPWEDLSGDRGLYRNRDTGFRPCQLQADNDWDATTEFLTKVPKSPQTFRSYQKECLRLLLVCRFYFRKPVSSLTPEDLAAYGHLLRHPPQAFIQPRRSKADPDYVPVTLFTKTVDSNGQPLLDPKGVAIRDLNPHWRPFQKALSESSANTALSIVKALMSFWVKSNYLSVSPFSLGGAAHKPNLLSTQARDAHTGTTLSPQALEAIQQALGAMPTSNERQRLRQVRASFIVECLTTLGLRMSELTNAMMSDVHPEHDRWWLRVVGPGERERNIPAVARFMRAFQAYRLSIGLPEQPSHDETQSPLVQYLKPGNRAAISEFQVRKIVKPIFESAADQLATLSDSELSLGQQANRKVDVQTLQQATPHWLRSTYAAQLQSANLDPQTILRCLGRSSAKGSSAYSRMEAQTVHQAVEGAFASG